jgi:hypothetical protein
MVIEKIKAELLSPAAYNPRKNLKPGDKEYEKLKRSVEEFGYIEPIIWNKSTGNVVGGHQRLKILLDLGHTEIDCVVVELDLQREKALNLALNKIQGDWDETKLAELMADLDASAFEVALTGFDAEEIDALLNRFYAKEAVQDEFDIDKEKEAVEQRGAVTQPGDTWLLGNHRLLCGDPTQPDNFTRLLEGMRGQLAVSSPSIDVEKEYRKDGLQPWMQRMNAAILNLTRNVDIACWVLNDLYATGSQFVEPTALYSLQMFTDAGFRPIWIRVWKQQGPLPGTGGQHLSSNKPLPNFEYVSAFAGSGADQPEYNDQEYVWLSAFAGHSYRFVRRLTKEERKRWGYSGIWEIAPVRASKSYPAMVPVELPWRCIKMHSDRNAVVVDPFAGAGTTIIAAEQTERRCYAMENDPIHCDLVVKRWEDFTGEKAVRMEYQP